MAHLTAVSRSPIPPKAATDTIETVIIILLSTIFSDWDNFPQVVQGLQKFYNKTP